MQAGPWRGRSPKARRAGSRRRPRGAPTPPEKEETQVRSGPGLPGV